MFNRNPSVILKKPQHFDNVMKRSVIIITVGVCIVLLCYVVSSNQQLGSQPQTVLWQPIASPLSTKQQADAELYQHQEEFHLTPEQQALVKESMARYI